MKRHAGQYHGEAWTLTDRATGRQLGTRAYPSLAAASKARAKLCQLAAQHMSREGAADVAARCDVVLQNAKA